MNQISGKEISSGYGNHLVLKNVDVEIPMGKITSIIGPNGCGKSTLLKTLSRIIPCKSGNVFLNEVPLSSLKTKNIAKIMAMLPQKPSGAEGLKVWELIALGRYPHQNAIGQLKKEDMAVIETAMEQTGVHEYREKEITMLSGGQLQKVWITMALAQETEIIFLDEPTTYLDLLHQLEILELLENLNRKQNRTIVMVLHDINQASRFSDFMIAMKEGKILYQGSPMEIMKKDVLKDVFHMDAFIGEDPFTKKPCCLSYRTIREVC